MNISGTQSDYYVAGLRLGFEDVPDIVCLENWEDFFGIFPGRSNFRGPAGEVGRRDFARLGRAFPRAKYVGHYYFIRILQARG